MTKEFAESLFDKIKKEKVLKDINFQMKPFIQSGSLILYTEWINDRQLKVFIELIQENNVRAYLRPVPYKIEYTLNYNGK